jgi:hypothetical protein
MTLPALPETPCSPADMRGKILQFEAAIYALPKEQQITELPVKHHFAPGIYMRELFIPKGVALTGKIHKTEHLNILAQGELTVWTEAGMKRVKAPYVVTSLPGIKRVGFAHEDSTWITVHHNPENVEDVQKLEDLLVTNNFDDLLQAKETNALEDLKEGVNPCHS